MLFFIKIVLIAINSFQPFGKVSLRDYCTVSLKKKGPLYKFFPPLLVSTENNHPFIYHTKNILKDIYSILFLNVEYGRLYFNKHCVSC